MKHHFHSSCFHLPFFFLFLEFHQFFFFNHWFLSPQCSILFRVCSLFFFLLLLPLVPYLTFGLSFFSTFHLFFCHSLLSSSILVITVRGLENVTIQMFAGTKYFCFFLPVVYSFLPPSHPPSLLLYGGRLGALGAQRELQQQLHVKLASPHSLQCNSSLLRRGKVICL